MAGPERFQTRFQRPAAPDQFNPGQFTARVSGDKQLGAGIGMNECLPRPDPVAEGTNPETFRLKDCLRQFGQPRTFIHHVDQPRVRCQRATASTGHRVKNIGVT